MNHRQTSVQNGRHNDHRASNMSESHRVNIKITQSSCQLCTPTFFSLTHAFELEFKAHNSKLMHTNMWHHTLTTMFAHAVFMQAFLGDRDLYKILSRYEQNNRA